MNRSHPALLLVTSAAIALLAAAAPTRPAAAAATTRASFEEADLYFELNDTDGDLGLHARIDGDAWLRLEIESPGGEENLRVEASGSLGEQGMTEVAFESDEPSFDELPPAEFFARFPAGRWEISALTLDGEELESSDRLRHVMPAPAGNITLSGVPAAADCDVEPLPAVTTPVVIAWDPVTGPHPEIGDRGPIAIVGYQLVVEREEPSLLVFAVDLPAEVTAFEVPADFTALGDAFKFEIVARERSGNQTAVESCFEIE
jgi:hypothetical protein